MARVGPTWVSSIEGWDLLHEPHASGKPILLDQPSQVDNEVESVRVRN